MLAPLAAIAAVLAPADSAELAGVWEGTVGSLPVRACFVRRDWGTFGAYYYLSQRRLIPLDGDEGAFREGQGSDGPRWVIERVAADRLDARWSRGRRSLPVRLRRMPADETEQGPCASLAFHQPRLEGVTTRTERAVADGVAYSRISLDHGGRFDAEVVTFAFDGSSDAVRAVNATLASALSGDPPEWFDCLRSAFWLGPNEGSYYDRLEPVLISTRWMSVIHGYEGFCGGAHPYGGTAYRAFDLESGREVDLHDWFTEAAVRRERLEEVDDEIRTVQPALRDFLLAGWSPEDPECDGVVSTAEFWNIGLTREALVFTPDLPRVVQACGDQFTIPFDRLGPFLTEEGAANLRSLSADR